MKDTILGMIRREEFYLSGDMQVTDNSTFAEIIFEKYALPSCIRNLKDEERSTWQKINAKKNKVAVR